MPVALVDFVTFDGEQMFAGISHVADGHDYVRRHPQQFGPASRAGKSRTWKATGSRSRNVLGRRPAFKSTRRVPDPPEIRGYCLDVPTVRVSVHAATEIVNQRLTTDHERGGGLYGRAEGHDIYVMDICANAELSRHSNSKLFLDVDAMLDQSARTKLDWIGTWHTHRLYREGGPAPSMPDRDSWSLCFQSYRSGYKPAFVGMLYGPSAPPDRDADPWFPPARGAWVVREENDETVIDPARLEFEYEL